MTWGILALILLGTAFLSRPPAKHPTGHFCRPQCVGMPFTIKKYSECGAEGDRDWCTGEVRRNGEWIPSEELIEGSWCASLQFQVGDKCVPRIGKEANNGR